MSNQSGPGPVPDRWLHCPRKSKSLIGDNKFLAFKTPLSNKFDSQVPEECRFPPQMLLDFTKRQRTRIGLWINLTNTTRFYDEREVDYDDDNGEIKYFHLECRGHGEAPSVDQTRCFVNMCEKFSKSYPLLHIGVHCTHGFNRTGFLIVCYLVEKVDWSLDAALQEFANARPPGIYKRDYIEELYRRYGDMDDLPPDAPQRPDWCLEYDDSPDDGQSSSSGGRGDKRKSSHNQRNNGRKFLRKNGKTPEFMEGIGGVVPVLEQPLLGDLQRTAREFCHFKGRDFPGCQPVSMDMDNIKLLKDKAYRVSWKADGTRYMMLIMGENQVYCIDRDNCVFQVEGLRFVNRKNLDSHLTDTLLDGEMVIDRHEGNCIPRYLVYDAIRVNGVDVSHMTFHPQRLLCIDLDIVKPRYQAIAQGKINKNAEPFSVRAKQFFPAKRAASFLSEKFSRQLTHEPDGLIFQPSAEPYVPGTCDEVLKWKPPSHNSIDFKLKLSKEEGMGIVTKKIGLLYVGGQEHPFDKIKFTKAIKDMDGKIIECKLENNQWVFMRQRTDKSFPNSYKTAAAVMKSITNPVTKEDLLNWIENYGFNSDDDRMPPPSSHHHHHRR